MSNLRDDVRFRLRMQGEKTAITSPEYYRIWRARGRAKWIASMASAPAAPMSATEARVPESVASAPISMLPNVITTLLMWKSDMVRPRNLDGE